MPDLLPPTAAPTEPPSFDALLKACEDASQSGLHLEGRRLAEQLLACAGAAPDRRALALYWLSNHQLRLGDLPATLETGASALRLLERTPMAMLRSRLHCALALACAQASRYPDALNHADQAVRTAELSGDTLARAWALNRLGTAHADLGDAAQGRSLLTESLKLARELGDVELEFASLNNLGSHLNWRSIGRAEASESAPQLFAAALATLREAHALALKLGNPHSLTLVQVNLAWAWREQGELAAALQAAEEAESLATAQGLDLLLIHARIERALSLLALQRPEPAYALLCDLRERLSPLDTWSHLTLHRGLVAAQRALGLFEQALATQERFHALAMEEARIRSELHVHVLKRQHELELARQQAQRARLEAEMQRLRAEQLRREAHEDALTGLYNRRFVDEQLPVLRERSRALGRPLLALMVDADHFKCINDRHGHRVGDEALRVLGALLLQHTRISDLAARLGGEELLLLMPDTAFAQALEVAERIRSRVEHWEWARLAPGLGVTVSIGLAPVGDGADPLGAADAALYRAKATGRNCVMSQASAAPVTPVVPVVPGPA